jgi:hypothetical protein
MTKDEITKLMQQACDPDKKPAWHNDFWTVTQEELERFVNLVAEAEAAKWAKGVKISLPTYAMEQQFSWYHRRGYEAGKALIPAAVASEREACAQVCEAQQVGRPSYFEIDERIRECAAAIRARGEV